MDHGISLGNDLHHIDIKSLMVHSLILLTAIYLFYFNVVISNCHVLSRHKLDGTMWLQF